MPRTVPTAALLVAAALLSSGCQSAQDRFMQGFDEGFASPAERGERAYLDALDRAAAATGSGVRGFGDEKNLELGRAVCADLAEGRSPSEVAAGLRGDDAIGAVATELVGAADAHLCPDR